MPLFKDLAGLLRAPVGNNLDNDPKDVENLKRNFAKEGRYKKPIENGYIDKELDDSIWSFQKDYNLKQDGRANPGGETEGTLISVLRGYQAPPSKEKVENPNMQIVNLARPILGDRLSAMIMGGAGAIGSADAWNKWQSSTTDDREKMLRDLDDAEEINRKCDQVDAYNRKICDEIYRRISPEAGAVGHKSASEILAACRRGCPENEWPDLQDNF